MACEPRTWDDDKRCASCCNGDRCDDPSHYDRQHCPHCKGTGWALWTEAGRRDYAAYLLGGNTSDKRAAILARVDGVRVDAPKLDNRDIRRLWNQASHATMTLSDEETLLDFARRIERHVLGVKTLDGAQP